MLISKMIKRINGLKIQVTKKSFSSHQNTMKKKTFENAISALNSLQTNSAALNISIKLKQQQIHNEANLNLRDTEKFLERIDGFDIKSLDNLSVIHVSGSKGKGSVCVYTDDILRNYNVKTGLFTSPHLISVTERIKLMGYPIDKNMFNKYFWEVYDALERKKSNENDLPSYFKFLQIMAFYIFVKEKVDVAIIEVGIGGEYDSTNILKNTEIVGITVLQLEHTQLLGNTIEEIAWQKAGIIKNKSYVYYMNQSSESVINVIENRFRELKGERLSSVPAFEDYIWQDVSVPDFSQTSEINKINFSLAAQLSARWLKNRKMLSENFFNDNDVLTTIEKRFIWAIQKFQFEGRFQEIKKSKDLTFFLDGAHTKDSICITSDWFLSKINKSNVNLNILMFNITGERDSEQILQPLYSIGFDVIIFTTNLEHEEASKLNENYSGVHRNVQYDRCIKHKAIWEKFCDEKNLPKKHVECCHTIQNAIDFIYNIKENNSIPINVLITGSLHLVGGALKIIKNVNCDDLKMEKINN